MKMYSNVYIKKIPKNKEKELAFLYYLKCNDNFVQIISHFFNHKNILCINLERGEFDLHNYLPIIREEERNLFAEQAISAVRYLHQHGIMHNDIKPKNFIIVNERLKLIDFGISYFEFEKRRPVSAQSLYYMSPELMLLDDQLSHFLRNTDLIDRIYFHVDINFYAADIWALGLTLYEIYTSKYFFDIFDIDIMTDNINKYIDNPTEYLKSLGIKFRIIQSALSIDISERLTFRNNFHNVTREEVQNEIGKNLNIDIN